MANDLRGEAALTAGSESLTIRFDYTALREAQVALSLRGAVDMFQAIERMDLQIITTLLWFGLKAKQPKMKLADVCALEFSIVDAMNALTTAISSMLGLSKESAEGKA